MTVTWAAPFDAVEHRAKPRLCLPQRAHAVVEAAWPQPPLRDLEAAPFLGEQVRRRHAHLSSRCDSNG